MSNHRWSLFVVLWLACVPSAAPAADLFVEQAPVVDEAAATRNAALSAMLKRVMVRVSGNVGVASQPAAAEVLTAAPSLVEQYRYRSVDEGGNLVRYLWARFDQGAVERMMRERGLPVWVQRPRVLVWLATERAGQRSLLALDTEPLARDAALGRAAERGLPLQLPLMDLEDQSALTPADLWSDYLQGIQSASARYPHERILTGRLTAAGRDRWRGVWTLIGPTASDGFQSPALGLDETVRFAVDQTQNMLAARYAPTPGGGDNGGVRVRFVGVYDLPRYGALLGLLEGLEPVRSLALRYVDGDDLVFEFQLRGDPQNLQRALEASGRVIAEPLPVMPTVIAPPTAGGGTTASASVAASFAPSVDYAYRLVN
jgi:hypothetical protein